jgi:hypothetical protein
MRLKVQAVSIRSIAKLSNERYGGPASSPFAPETSLIAFPNSRFARSYSRKRLSYLMGCVLHFRHLTD